MSGTATVVVAPCGCVEVSEGGDTYIEVMTSTTRASLLCFQGRYDESLELSRQAQTALRTMGATASECENLLHIAQTLAASDRAQEACQAYAEAETMAASLGNPHVLGRAMLGLGRSVGPSDPTVAAEKLPAAVTTFEKLGVPEEEVARQALAELHRSL